jgi:ABC-type dipeptide/oligopeptide/nickel transport system permease component
MPTYSLQDYLDRAEAALNKGDLRAAEALIRQSLAMDPHHLPAWRLLYTIKGAGQSFETFQVDYSKKIDLRLHQFSKSEIIESLEDTQPLRKPKKSGGNPTTSVNPPSSINPPSSLVFISTMIAKRVLFILAAIIVVNFIAHSYALVSLQAQQATNPYGSTADGQWPAIIPAYISYAEGVLQGDLGLFPGSETKITSIVGDALSASLGLLLVAILISTTLGLIIGLACVRVEPARVTNWLAPFTSVGLAMPGFFLGTLFIAFTVYWLLGKEQGTPPPLPIFGFGWDLHLVLPVLALSIRPMAQIAQSTSSLLAGELDKQYITTSRAMGNSWTNIRRKNALKNVLAPIIVNIASSMRMLVAELILVEWIFSWPGIGQLLAQTLIPPATASVGGLGITTHYFLFPPLVAILLTIFAFLFVIIDSLSSTLSQIIDPRLHDSVEQEATHG